MTMLVLGQKDGRLLPHHGRDHHSTPAESTTEQGSAAISSADSKT
jgi:hypothetical protein